MTAALVQGTSVLQTWDIIPNPLALPNSSLVYCAQAGWTDGDYSVVAASYTDTPPSYPASIVSQTAVLVNGAVQITRTWTAPPAVPPPGIRPVTVNVNSASNPALNAIYSIAPADMKLYSDMNAQTLAFGSFQDGAASIVIDDASGIPHRFNVAALQAFYNAVAYYSSALAFGSPAKTPLTIP